MVALFSAFGRELCVSAPKKKSKRTQTQDNQAAMHNLLAGSAADSQSKDIVAAIWLLLAVLGTTLWVEWVPSEANPADCFSRPCEPEKQAEVVELVSEFNLQLWSVSMPGQLGADPDAWRAVLEAAQNPQLCRQRHRAPPLLEQKKTNEDQTRFLMK